MADRVEFWFDPVSPWCWVASRWMQSVSAERDIDLSFHVMSLAVLNEGKKLPEKIQSIVDGSWPFLRVLVAVGQKEGDAAVGRLYTEIGTRLHNHKSDQPAGEMIAESLNACSLDVSYLDVIDTIDYDQVIRSLHSRRDDESGSDLGAPTIRVNGVSFFGPALSRIPSSEDSVKLYDAVISCISYPHFFEMQRPRTERPIFD